MSVQDLEGRRRALRLGQNTIIVRSDIPPYAVVLGVFTGGLQRLDGRIVILLIALAVDIGVERETERIMGSTLVSGGRTNGHLRNIQAAPVGPGLDTVGEIAGDPALDGDLLQTVGGIVSDGRAADVSIGTVGAPLLEGGLDTGLIEGLGIGGDPSAIGGLGLGEEDAGGGDHGQSGVHGEHEVAAGLGLENAYFKLKSAADALEGTDCAGCVRIDFSTAGDRNYYNGIAFKGYVEGVPERGLSGGQYDRLVRRFLPDGEAIGFAVYVDSLEKLPRQREEFDGDVLLIYGADAPQKDVLKAVIGLNAGGLSVKAAPSDEAEALKQRYRRTAYVDGKGDVSYEK